MLITWRKRKRLAAPRGSSTRSIPNPRVSRDVKPQPMQRGSHILYGRKPAGTRWILANPNQPTAGLH